MGEMDEYLRMRDLEREKMKEKEERRSHSSLFDTSESSELRRLSRDSLGLRERSKDRDERRSHSSLSHTSLLDSVDPSDMRRVSRDSLEENEICKLKREAEQEKERQDDLEKRIQALQDAENIRREKREEQRLHMEKRVKEERENDELR